MPVIRPYQAHDQAAVLALSLRAWQPVFAQLRSAVPRFVYQSFYPEEWEKRQHADLQTLLEKEPKHAWVACVDGVPAGWMHLRFHPEDSMAEIHVLAVDPACQRKGLASALMQHAFELARKAGMKMVMVETGDDPGHEPARHLYENAGFERWPVARYFKSIETPP